VGGNLVRQKKIPLTRTDRREIESERYVAQKRKQLVAIEVEVNLIGFGGVERAASFRCTAFAVLEASLVIVRQQRSTTHIGRRSALYPANNEAMNFDNFPRRFDRAI
jgi:hypothetical protein